MQIRGILKFFLFGLFLVFQVYLFFFKEFPVLDYTRYGNETPLPLGGENNEVCQEFRTSGPLTRIDIMLANYLIKPQHGMLRLTIFKDNRRLFLKNYPANKAEDNRFYSFQLPDVKARQIPKGHYLLQLDYFAQDVRERLAVWISKEDLYPYGSLRLNNVPQGGDMTFRVYYHSTLWNAKDKWLHNVPVKPFQGYLLAGALLLLLLLVNVLFYFLSGLLEHRK